MTAIRRAAAAVLVLAAAGPAAAQNRGQDPAKFVQTHYNSYNEWELFCGHFGDPKAERCELRRTEIISPRPRFRAMVIFLRFDADGPRLTVDAERTTTWVGGGIKIDGQWFKDFALCGFGRCVVEGSDAKNFVARLAGAGKVTLTFRDIDELKEADWDLADLKKGLAELSDIRKKRNLP